MRKGFWLDGYLKEDVHFLPKKSHNECMVECGFNVQSLYGCTETQERTH